ncbi:hypothetical protein [Nocardia cyriacigeorgica]|uniref:hypothetical protein n=1 Tax=Nocardia cyriacigeorgica TaxID=135487 RepID=UPI002458C8D4|nr:hypothetical protein [Nocardia cyriacigeorgica]
MSSRYTGKFHGDPVGGSEFSWGAGLVPPGREGAPPSQGGWYSGKSPEIDEPPGLAALAAELAERATYAQRKDQQ